MAVENAALADGCLYGGVVFLGQGQQVQGLRPVGVVAQGAEEFDGIRTALHQGGFGSLARGGPVFQQRVERGAHVTDQPDCAHWLHSVKQRGQQTKERKSKKSVAARLQRDGLCLRQRTLQRLHLQRGQRALGTFAG